MLNRITLSNFKCFKQRTQIDIERINLFTGINGRGKSTALQSMLLMRQSLEHNRNSRQIILNGECIEIGNFEDLKNSSTSIGESILLSFGYSKDDNNIEITYYLNETEYDKTVAEISKIFVSGKLNNSEIEFSLLNKKEGIFIKYKEKKQEFICNSFFDLFIDNSTSSSEIEEISRILNFNKIHYVSADRIGPQDFYPKTSFKDFPNVGSKGQFTINLLFKMKDHQVYDNLFIQKDAPNYLLDQTQAWLSFIFKGGKLNISDTEANILTLGMNHDGSSTFYKPSNLGFGYSYILPIIVSGLLAGKEEILIVENPEAHLHSSSQSRLIKFLAMVSANGVQVFIETHSDHVLNALRVYIKQGEIESDDLNVYYFQSDKQQQIIPIPILENGRIETWPTGFFDQMDKDFAILFDE